MRLIVLIFLVTLVTLVMLGCLVSSTSQIKTEINKVEDPFNTYNYEVSDISVTKETSQGDNNGLY